MAITLGTIRQYKGFTIEKINNKQFGVWLGNVVVYMASSKSDYEGFCDRNELAAL